jgi:DNA-binding NarL/FixJ family response regulator
MTDARRVRVVLADDTTAYRDLLRLILELDGRFEIVAEAENGREAIDVTVAERPDVIVLDVAMPVMDGLQAIPELRAGAPGTAIVVLSGFARGHVDDDALAQGAVAYVEKGEAVDTIVDALLEAAAVRL